jgi:hypothetical protein
MSRRIASAVSALSFLLTIACSDGGGDRQAGAPTRAPAEATPSTPETAAATLMPDQQALSKIVAEGSTKGISDALGGAQWTQRDLDMADVRRFAAAVRNLREVQSDPEFQARSGAQVQSGTAAIQSTVMAEPRLRQAIESAGLSVDDYVQIAGSLAQAMMVATLMKQPGAMRLTERILERKPQLRGAPQRQLAR